MDVDEDKPQLWQLFIIIIIIIIFSFFRQFLYAPFGCTQSKAKRSGTKVMSTRHGFLLGTKIIFSLLSLSACVPQCVCVCVCVAVSVPLRVCCQWRPLSPCKLSRLKGKSQRRGIVGATLSWARLTHTRNVASPTSHQDTLNQSAVVARNTNSAAW